MSSSPRKPNILWLFTDEQRPDSLGCYGSDFARTPHLDALAARGALFRTAITPAPVCVPARAALLTGLTPSSTGVRHNKAAFSAPPRFLTYAFREAGYASASIGKQHYNCPSAKAFETEVDIVLGDAVHYFGYRKGYRHEDFGVVQYPGGPESRWVLAGRYPEAAETTPEARTVDRALAWLDGRGAGSAPYFLCVSLNNPHTPVTAPAPYDECVDGAAIERALGDPARPLPQDRPRWETEYLREYAGAQRLNPDQIRAARRCYYGCVSHVDAQFGRLLGRMKERGWLEDTLVVFMSDHGAGLGEAGMFQKQTFYEPVVSVPFFFAWPGRIPAGVSLKTPVETLSLLPTLLELAGLPVPGGLEAPSLARELLAGREPAARPVFSELDFGTRNYRTGDRLAMVRDGRWKLMLYRDLLDPARFAADPQGCLYDLESDPQELTNLFARPERRGTVEALTATLDARDAALYRRGTGR